jgi:hypothetical protein
MNSLYTLGVRQTNSIQADLERLRNGDCSAQISASLAAMHRTVDDYDSMAKRELIKVKQEKAQMYVCYPKCVQACLLWTAYLMSRGWQASAEVLQ